MKACRITLVLLTFFSIRAFAFDQSHSSWSQVLKAYVSKGGGVQYGQLSRDAKSPEHTLNVYLETLQKVSEAEFSAWKENEKKAFLINAYNAFTVKLILNNYPVSGIKKIGGWLKKPWDVEFFSLLDGKIKSLDPIEHKWLRPLFRDFRIHAAVNCASVSCPQLRGEAFVADKLDVQLDEQMKNWILDETRNQWNSKENVLMLSKIFDWYKSDFEDWGKGVLTVVGKHIVLPQNPEAKSAIKIKYLEYDWSLNEAK